MYAFDSRIRYSETDSEGYLTPGRITELFSGLFHLPFGGCGAGNRLYEGDWSGLGPFLLADRGEPLSEIRGKSKDRDAAL